MRTIEINGNYFEIDEYHTIIIGSGAAGLNCALHLVMEGISPKNIAIVTERLKGGTSFNAGSDKQTYYKMSIIGNQLDSPFEMAQDLSSGGAMHGDIALVEATNSIGEFFHLVHLGVPFPHDELGGYVGYKTDFDPRQRATSIGPLTSQKMSECLLTAVIKHNIPIFDKYYALRIINNDSCGSLEAVGVICLNLDNLGEFNPITDISDSIRVFKAKNIVIATGGPAQIYKNSVYPQSHHGSMGLAIEAGCTLQNLTESQFGIASTKFRWNLSGSYQQVIPRYFSRDNSYKEREFLYDIFPSFNALSKAIFLKGHEWPFDSAKIQNFGSSLVDMAIQHEIEFSNRKVYIDFTQNPKDYSFSRLPDIVKEYLTKSNAYGEYPIDRLRNLNENAIKIYKSNGIDLATEPMEIGICNQHLNGGVAGNIWWESINVQHLFVIGEANGNHGIYRPGGSALNAGQVGGLRSAQKIAKVYDAIKSDESNLFDFLAKKALQKLINEFELLSSESSGASSTIITIDTLFKEIQERMAKYGAIYRPLNGIDKEINTIQWQLKELSNLVKISNNNDILDYFKLKDALITQLMFLKAIQNYHNQYGSSRGSFLIFRDKLNKQFSEKQFFASEKLDSYPFIISDNNYTQKIQLIRLVENNLLIEWEDVRSIPLSFGWFETIWKDYNTGRIYK